jgi:hypothetical protein
MGMTGAQAAALSGVIQDAASRNTIASSAPYYSRVFFTSAGVDGGGGSFTYTFPAGVERRAFGYAKTDPIPGAPFLAPANEATPADTNLMTKGQTLAGQTVLIQGVSVMVQPGSDFEAAKEMLTECSVSIGLNGDSQQMEMGTPLNLPGIGGLYGWGFSRLIAPAAQNNAGGEFAKLGSNGVPGADNFRRVPEGLIWRPAGKTDGTLVIKFRSERAVVVGPVLSRAAQANPLIFAYTPPASVKIDLMCHLICIAISDASVNL